VTRAGAGRRFRNRSIRSSGIDHGRAHIDAQQEPKLLRDCQKNLHRTLPGVSIAVIDGGRIAWAKD
jgi:hypothetical protein